MIMVAVALLGLWGAYYLIEEVFISEEESQDDEVRVGQGDDIVAAGAGNDEVFGGVGDDTLIGESGHDTLVGERGDDSLNGGQGNDRLYGGANQDTLVGGGGHDNLLGESGNDMLFGGAGDDDLLGGYGSDTMHGGSGQDFFLAGEGDQVMGGTGNDFIYTDGQSELTGGQGEDMFIAEYFMDSSNPVIITDFEPGVDRLIVTPTNSSLGVPSAETLDTADISQIFPSPWDENIVMPSDFQLRVVDDVFVSYLTNSTGDGTDIYIGATKVVVLEGVLPNEIGQGDITLTMLQ